MATTRIMPLHIGKDRSVSTAISQIIDYVENPEKTDYGRLITGFECDTRTADAEFALSKRQYFAITGRKQGSDDVIAYHLRQSFLPGTVTPEEANEIGYELAMSLTKGRHAFIVCTHIDKHHVHNHVIFNSTNIDCMRKFRNFWRSTWAVRRISDRICLEHGLPIIENPQPSRGHYGKWQGEYKKPSFHEQIRQAINQVFAEDKPADMDDFMRMMEAKGFKAKRGKHLAFLAPGAKKYTRCDNLKGDYTEQAIQERIDGKRQYSHSTAGKKSDKRNPPGMELLVDIQAAMRAGKGPGYERWAKVFNAKQLANAINYLLENGSMDYTALREKADSTGKQFNDIADKIKMVENHLHHNSELQKHIINYSKTRRVYVDYRKAGYSKKYLAEHEAEILLHKAAKKAFDDLGLDRIPKVTELRSEYATLFAEKKRLYSLYKKARVDMREVHNAKANIDALLGMDDKRSGRRKER